MWGCIGITLAELSGARYNDILVQWCSRQKCNRVPGLRSKYAGYNVAVSHVMAIARCRCTLLLGGVYDENEILGCHCVCSESNVLVLWKKVFGLMTLFKTDIITIASIILRTLQYTNTFLLVKMCESRIFFFRVKFSAVIRIEVVFLCYDHKYMTAGC